MYNSFFHQDTGENFLIETQNSEAINVDKFDHIKTKGTFVWQKPKDK